MAGGGPTELPPPTGDDDDEPDGDDSVGQLRPFKNSSSASGRLHDVFYVLRMMSKARRIRRAYCIIASDRVVVVVAGN
jgi:hypothetical protein